MKLVSAIFPGSFDPFTNGHLDIVARALNFFENVYVAVLANSSKSGLFSVEERVSILNEVLAEHPGARVQSFSGLLVDFSRKLSTKVIIRGLRAVSDYDYEAQIALMNRNLAPDIETFFLIAKEENSYISSTLVKQVALMGGDVSKFVPPAVKRALDSKIAKI